VICVLGGGLACLSSLTSAALGRAGVTAWPGRWDRSCWLASAAGCEGELAFEPGIALVTRSAVTGGLG